MFKLLILPLFFELLLVLLNKEVADADVQVLCNTRGAKTIVYALESLDGGGVKCWMNDVVAKN